MVKIYRNSAWNTLGVVVPAIIAIPALGVLARGLGPDTFGLYSILFIILGYSGIFDAGITKSIVYFVSSDQIEENYIGTLVNSACVFLVTVSLIVILPLLFITDNIFSYFNAEIDRNYQQVTSNIKLVLIAIPIVLLNLVFQGFLEGREKFFQLSILKMTINPLSSVLPATSVLLFGTLDSAIICLVMAKTISLLVTYSLYSRDVKVRIVKSKLVSMKALNDLVKFGGWISVSNILSPLMSTVDRFLIASTYGAHSISMYSVAADAVTKFSILPVSIAKVVFPIFANSNRRAIHKIVQRQSTMLIGATTFVFVCTAIIFAENIVTVWFGKEYSGDTVTVFQILLFGVFFNSIAQVPYSILQARGQARTTAILHAIEIIPHLIFMFYMVIHFQIIGAAISIAVRSMFDSLILYILEKKGRHLE